MPCSPATAGRMVSSAVSQGFFTYAVRPYSHTTWKVPSTIICLPAGHLFSGCLTDHPPSAWPSCGVPTSAPGQDSMPPHL